MDNKYEITVQPPSTAELRIRLCTAFKEYGKLLPILKSLSGTPKVGSSEWLRKQNEEALERASKAYDKAYKAALKKAQS